MTQTEKCAAFLELHSRESAFLIPNPWSKGTARLLHSLGFEALATTSVGYAFSVARPDNSIGRDEIMAHVAAIVSATPLPVSADLENGFGEAPETVAETIRLGAAAGLAGGSIEDATGNAHAPIFEFEHAVDRVRAAAEASRALPFPFTFTARAENYLHGRADLKDTIKRLQAFQEAGADVLYAPGLLKREDIAAVVSSVDVPVNVLVSSRSMGLTLADLSAMGVKRVSVGSALALAALGSFLRAAKELKEHGTFEFTGESASYRDLNALFALPASGPASKP